MTPSTAVLLGALALTASPERKLTFDEAIALSVRHPAHRGLERALETRRREDAELGPLANDPQLLVMPGYRLDPAEDAGFEAQVQLTQSWNLAGLGGLRKSSAARERAALLARLRADALTRRLGAAHGWIRLRVAEEDLQRLERARGLAGDLTEKLKVAATAGAVLRTALVEARAYEAEVAAQVVEAEGHRVHHAFDLSSALGSGPDVELATAGAWPGPSLPTPEAWPGLVARAAELPRARQAALTALARRAQAAETSAQGAWILQTQLAFQRESPSSYISWLGLAVTAPVFDGAQRSRSLAEADRARAEVSAEAASSDAGRALAEALHEVEHGRERLAVAETELLPALRELVALRTRAFEQGEGTALELLRARQRALEAERGLGAARGELRWAEVQAWLLLAAMDGGAPLAARKDER